MSSTSSFSKILSILSLFNTGRSIINVDIICEELNVSKPMGYRYLKELVEADFLKKSANSVGDYVLGSKIAILDYVSRTTDPIIQISVPVMRDVVKRTEMICLLTVLEDKHCIDVCYESLKPVQLGFGRGYPRELSVGSSAKVILANLSKKQQIQYYDHLADDLASYGYAHDQLEFLQQMRSIKKQGYYISKGEFSTEYSSISVPLKFSHKEAPWSLTLLTSINRFEFLNVDKMVEVLKQATAAIEQQLVVAPE